MASLAVRRTAEISANGVVSFASERRRPERTRRGTHDEELMSEPVFTVTPAAGRGWLVRRAAADSSDFFGDRRRAIEHAHALALAARPAMVRVLGSSGAVEDEWLFGPGKGVRRIGPLAPREAGALEV
jgi:hypothetical protein